MWTICSSPQSFKIGKIWWINTNGIQWDCSYPIISHLVQPLTMAIHGTSKRHFAARARPRSEAKCLGSAYLFHLYALVASIWSANISKYQQIVEDIEVVSIFRSWRFFWMSIVHFTNVYNIFLTAADTAPGCKGVLPWSSSTSTLTWGPQKATEGRSCKSALMSLRSLKITKDFGSDGFGLLRVSILINLGYRMESKKLLPSRSAR